MLAKLKIEINSYQKHHLNGEKKKKSPLKHQAIFNMFGIFHQDGV